MSRQWQYHDGTRLLSYLSGTRYVAGVCKAHMIIDRVRGEGDTRNQALIDLLGKLGAV